MGIDDRYIPLATFLEIHPYRASPGSFSGHWVLESELSWLIEAGKCLTPYRRCRNLLPLLRQKPKPKPERAIHPQQESVTVGAALITLPAP